MAESAAGARKRFRAGQWVCWPSQSTPGGYALGEIEACDQATVTIRARDGSTSTGTWDEFRGCRVRWTGRGRWKPA